MKELPENEKWVKGYEGMYSVSDEGKVYSYKRKNKLEMVGAVTKQRGSDSYHVYCFSKNGVNYTAIAHRIIAEAFVPNPEGKPTVRHLDGDKLNNVPSNLQWSTYSENTQAAWSQGKFEAAVMREEERKARVDALILNNDSDCYNGSYIKAMITKEDLVRNHVPAEMIGVNKAHKSDNISPLYGWNHYIDLFRLCDDTTLKLAVVAMIVGFDQSTISCIRNNKRCTAARKIYDKYKDDPYYFVNYKPVY